MKSLIKKIFSKREKKEVEKSTMTVTQAKAIIAAHKAGLPLPTFEKEQRVENTNNESQAETKAEKHKVKLDIWDKIGFAAGVVGIVTCASMFVVLQQQKDNIREMGDTLNVLKSIFNNTDSEVNQ